MQKDRAKWMRGTVGGWFLKNMAKQACEGRALTLEPVKSNGELNVIIETPKGSRHKYKYDAESGMFALHKVMPTGTVFPFDFGFLPSTRGQMVIRLMF